MLLHNLSSLKLSEYRMIALNVLYIIALKKTIGYIDGLFWEVTERCTVDFEEHGAVPCLLTGALTDCGNFSLINSTHSLGKKPTWARESRKNGFKELTKNIRTGSLEVYLEAMFPSPPRGVLFGRHIDNRQNIANL